MSYPLPLRRCLAVLPTLLVASAAYSQPTVGLTLWLKADAGVTLVGNSVTEWSDQSGNNVKATQATAGQQPALVSSAVNGKPAIKFDGVNDFLTFTLATNGNTAMTLFLVSQSDIDYNGDWNGVARAPLFFNETAGWGALHLSPFQRIVRWRFGTTQANNLPTYSRPVTIGSTFSISTALKNGATETLYVNGIQALQVTGKLPSVNGVHPTGNLGRGYDNNTFFPGQIAEVLIYNRALPDAERQQVEQYLSQKYLAAGPPANTAPSVNAGPDVTVTLPNAAALNGTATDDAQPNPALSISWSKVSGPGTVAFNPANSAVSSASFSAAGTYVLRLTANDGALTSADDVAVTVNGANTAPSVNAGPDVTVTLPNAAALNGTATDDGQPNPALSISWSKVSGPGTVTFNPANSAVSSASFSAAGTYVLRLTGNDGALTSTDDVAVTVNNANTAPSVNAGPDVTVTLPNAAALSGTATDDGQPNPALSISWSKVSGPGTVTFNPANSAVSSASFSAAGTYVLRLTANDGALTSTDDVTLTVNGANTAPSVNAGPDVTVTLPNAAALNGTATDDGQPNPALSISWSKVSGPGTVTFNPANSAVSSASFSAAGTYVLRLTANDGALTSTDDVAVTVNGEVPPGPIPTAGMKIWLKADAGVVLNGSAVTQWNDQSGNNVNAAQLTASQQPLLAVGAVNSKPAVKFDGVNDFLTFSLPTNGNSAMTLFLVSQSDIDYNGDWNGVVRAPLFFNETAGWGALHLSPFQRIVRWRFGTGQANNLPTYTRPASIGTAFSISAALKNGGTETLYINGVQALQQNGKLPTIAGVQTTGNLGRGYDNSSYFPGQIAEVLIYDRALSDTERQQVEQYLSQKYLVTGPPPVNTAPSVNAGPDVTVTLPSAASLNGTATDDGQPNPTLSISWSKVSGPGTVTFNPTNAAVTSGTFSTAGSYVLRLTASDGALTSTDDVSVTVNGANTAPSVNAGPDVSVTLPSSASLNGSATDDGRPNPTLSISWSKVSGPGTVTFNPTNAAVTSGTFSTAGSYVLRLTASDGALTSTDDVTVTVNGANTAPSVNAGPDVTVTLPSSASLNGTATDDGQPNPTLSISWSKVSGPGTVTFNPTNAAVTSGTFSAAGSYVLRLTASDGALTSTDDVTVTVNGANTAPSVNAGPDVTVTLPSSASLNGTATDDGRPNPTLSISWSKVSGPGTVTFNPTNAAVTSGTFSTAGSYVLRLTASDGALTSTDDVTVTVNADIPSGPIPTSGMRLWLKADAGVVLNGSAVTQWSDQSGNNVHASQATGGLQPLLVGSAVNGKPALKFDGTNDFLTFTLPANGNTAMTLFLVSQSDIDYDGSSIGVMRAPLFFNETGGWGTLHLSPFQRIVRWRFGTGQGNNLPSYTRPVSIGNAFSISSALKNGAAETLYINGAQALQQTGKLPTVAFVAPTGNLGRGYDNNTYFPGQIAEVVIYDRALSETERQQVEQYLNQKYLVAPPNQAPLVSAGPDISVTLPGSATLNGSATDDGQLNPALALSWTKVSGPGTVNFSAASAAVTQATFSTSGTYVVRLTASDGGLSSFDEATITVNPQGPPVNQPPSVSAGQDLTITLPASASLTGAATDDGLPSGSLTVGWSKVSGPGTVTFSAANASSSAATFSAAGTYVVRLTASDGLLAASDDATITVNAPDTTAPAISNVQVSSVTGTSATITWETNEPADSQVDFGTTASYGQSSPLNPALVLVHSITLNGLSPATPYHFRVRSKDAANNPGASGDQNFTTASSGWWNLSWHYRLPVSVGSASFERLDKPVEIDLNFTQLLAQLGQTGVAFPESSIRVIEVDSAGVVLDSAVPYQFDKDAAWEATTNAKGTLIFLLKGTTLAGVTRTFHVYFDNTAKTPLTVTPLVNLTDNVTWEGQVSYKVDTVSPTGAIGTQYYYHKLGGGFASMIDKAGRDWLGYHPGNGYFGEFRGIPNLVYPEGQFHPGNLQSASQVLAQGPLHVRIQTTTNDGLWKGVWDIFPDYARFTLLKKAHTYWFLYEGVPGGTLDANDYWVMSNGTVNPVVTGSVWRGDLPDPDWVYFGDNTLNRVLYLARHSTTPLSQNEYYNGGGVGGMTVFGFGRSSNAYLLEEPATFTIGFAETKVFASASKVIGAAYRDLSVTPGTVQSQF